ncbi:phage virion morphogenesis protein [Shewanella yunxiaonensis]|uniref:Phage virion morphogenesis protein n=1 Tax=Shewanella yunxiaonensis TaxID=2829809 RepID=A0ABX7YUH0_9GAMM|nr:phage virion morphogenesis protein [Shewanella yunxiaonensis]QUN06438.1 phage virion morphogenesis protein [Shewanella yunxiaonensis]
MAGVNLTITETGFDELSNAFQKLQQHAGDLKPAMTAIGEYLLGSNQDRIEQGVTPDGEAFAPLSDVTKSRKKKNVDKILIENGYLFNLAYNAFSNAVEIGTPMIYGAVMFYGADKGEFGNVNGHPIPWGNIPAREYLGINTVDEQEILATLGDYLLSDV